MELRHLRYFIAVADAQNFTKAAQALFISQPPLSRQIKQLEDELGVVLFKREQRPLQLTEAGHFFYAHAQQILAKMNELKTMTQRVGHTERTLTIGYVASTLYGMLPKIIHEYRQRYPHIALSLQEMHTLDQLSALKAGSIDVGFGRIRLQDPNVRRIVLREETLMLAVPCAHRLCQHPNITLWDLLDEKLILYPKAPRPSLADQVLASFHEAGLQPTNVLEVRELQIAIGLVAAGEGVAIVPTSLKGMGRADLTFLPLSDAQATSPIIMSVRMQEYSEDLIAMLSLIYDLYDQNQIAYIRQSL